MCKQRDKDGRKKTMENVLECEGLTCVCQNKDSQSNLRQ